MNKEIQELQKQSNAQMKKLRQLGEFTPEVDKLLSIMNSRLRLLERLTQERDI